MTTIRAIIVDDEPLTRERVRTLAGEETDVEIVGEARNGREAIELIARVSPHLVFMDVEMPELGGFEAIAALETEVPPIVVFITAYERYAVKAFDVGAADYLHKPITRQRFAAAMQRVRERIVRMHRTRYVIRRGATQYLLPVGDIDWIDAADNYLELHAAGRTHLCRGTMRQAEEDLDPARFVRVHRSAIVAVDRVRSVASVESGGLQIVLRDGTTLRASRQYADQVRRLIAE